MSLIAVKRAQASAVVTVAMAPQSRKVRCTSKGGPSPLVSDHAKRIEPSIGPAALKPEERDIASPLTRPRWRLRQEWLMTRKTHVKEKDWQTCARRASGWARDLVRT